MPTSASAPETLAVVDMGSNSFRLEVGRVEGDQIFRLDTWRENAAHRRRHRRARTPRARSAARGARLPRALRRAHHGAASVGRARGRDQHVSRRDQCGDVPAAGRARARASRSTSSPATRKRASSTTASRTCCRASPEPRLVIDIGGGSTEFIIGRGLEPERLESLKIGCVGLTQRFFADGRLTAQRVRRRRDRRARRNRGDRAATSTASTGRPRSRRRAPRSRWRKSSSRTAFRPRGITPDGLARLRKRMIGCGHVERLRLAALKPERAPVLAGGPRDHGGGAGRARRAAHQSGRRRAAPRRALRSSRTARSVATCGSRRSTSSSTRYRIDREHAARVAAMAVALYRSARVPARTRQRRQRLEWAALLHEIGFSVSHTGFHKHGAYILQNADMPGFSAAGAARPRAPRAGLPRRTRPRWGRALADARLSRTLDRAAARRALPPRAAADRDAARRVQVRRPGSG